MGTHPLQGDNRELTMVERVPEEGSGRPQCQTARTRCLKKSARGGHGFGSPKKSSHEGRGAGESRGGRERGTEWTGGQERRSKRGPGCPASATPRPALGTAGKKPASRVRTKLGFKRRLPGTSPCVNTVVDRKASCHGSHRQAQFFL